MQQGQVWQVAPYMARVVFANFQGQGGQAGGSIISHRHVLTSGFAITADFVNLQVWVGGTTRNTQQQLTVAINPSRINHPQYQASPRLNDIGIVLLAIDANFTRLVQPIALPALPAPGVPPTIPYLNEQGTALGFGLAGQQGKLNYIILKTELIFVYSQDLQAAFLRIVTAARCSAQYPQHNPQNQFCGEDARMRSDICSNDVGGPFITLQRGVEVLTGISSVAFCNQNAPSQPSLFTRVSAFRTWINQNAGV